MHFGCETERESDREQKCVDNNNNNIIKSQQKILKAMEHHATVTTVYTTVPKSTEKLSHFS